LDDTWQTGGSLNLQWVSTHLDAPLVEDFVLVRDHVGAVEKTIGTRRLEGRRFSSKHGSQAPKGPARYLFGLAFQEDAA
jgi:hypothetical protein